MTQPYHIPALLNESVNGMNISSAGIYVDVTFGGGGHSGEILSRLGPDGHLYAFDQDEDAIENIPPDSRFTFIRSNFCYLKNFIKYHEVEAVDAILADLGVSSHHFDDQNRGFSFRFEDSTLDMRMNKKGDKTAAQILNTYTEEQLADVFFLYGELKQARRIASVVVKTRKDKPYKKTSDLLDTLSTFVGRGEKEKKVLAQAFQALRIEVNDEMETLKDMLEQALDILKPGGRIAVITYHSLEDRLVKNFFKTGNFEGKVEKDFYGNFDSPFKLINNRVIIPTKEEEGRNPRSRSAKLRIAEKNKTIEKSEAAKRINEMKAKDIRKKVMYILGGTVLTEDFFWKNARFIITVFVILVLYISNRYSCIEKRAKIETLQHDLKDAKYESLTISAQLMSLSRESKVESLIQKNGVDLHQTKEPIYRIEKN